MMDDALEVTFYCDHAHPDIQAAASELRSGEKDPVAIAGRTFDFVRDQCSFGFDLFQRKASETLSIGHGACWNKSLLLVALLRGNKIPARFGSIPLKRNFIQPAIGIWHRLAGHPYNHCLVHAFLKRRWTILDAVLDQVTYATFFLPAEVEWSIDWNGEDDVCLYTESVLGPPVVHPDIDATLDRKVGNLELPRFLATIGNRYVNRKMWKRTKVGRRSAPDPNRTDTA